MKTSIVNGRPYYRSTETWSTSLVRVLQKKKVTVVRLDICQQHNLEILVNFYQYNIMCTNKFWRFFDDFEALFRDIGTIYVIQSIVHLFVVPLTIFQAAYGYRV